MPSVDQRPRRRWLWAFVPFVLVVSLLLASFRISVPYYRIAPGSARGITDLINVPPERAHPATGEFMLTTVSLGEARAIDAFLGWLDPDVDVVPRERIVPPDTSGKEYIELNRQVMEQSKQTAIVVALRRLGFEIVEQGQGAIVAAVGADLPASGRLSVGDVVTSVDGTPVTTSSEAVREIQRKGPGQNIVLQVLRGGADEPSTTVEIVPVEQPSDPTRPLIGVQLRTHKQHFDLPYPVDVESKAIGGPSAGLAFTLGIIDALSPGELSGGNKVAVTGTIDIDGTVGDVGGVVQKAVAVRKSGAKIFIVPLAEERVAKAHVGKNVRVVGVSTLEEAIAALGRLGGDVAALAPAAGGSQG